MDKYVLRLLVLGQLAIVGLLALTGSPANDATYLQAILQTIGLFAALDITGLTFAYVIRSNEFKSFIDFIKAIW